MRIQRATPVDVSARRRGRSHVRPLLDGCLNGLRRTGFAGLLAALSVSSVGQAQPAAPESSPLQVGVAKVDITPKTLLKLNPVGGGGSLWRWRRFHRFSRSAFRARADCSKRRVGRGVCRAQACPNGRCLKRRPAGIWNLPRRDLSRRRGSAARSAVSGWTTFATR
jgi:hypothetical protein